jgi:hypothetical protein
MRLFLVFACALLVAGCGVLDDEGPALSQGPDPAVYGPPHAVPREAPPIEVPDLRPPSGQVARELDAGVVGVVDVTGAVGVRPTLLDTARDARVESLTWTRWGEDGATATGDLRLRDCQPNCARGLTQTIPATVTLSGVRVCEGRHYFTAAEVRIDPALTPSGEQPATYVRAPC